MVSAEQLATVKQALDEGRPLDALAMLAREGELSGPALEAWCFASLEAGHHEPLRRRARVEAPEATPEDRHCLEAYALIASGRDRGAPPAKALVALLEHPCEEGEILHSALTETLIKTYLVCGAPALATRTLEGGQIAESVRRHLLAEVARARGESPADGDEQSNDPGDRARALAAAADWPGLEAEVDSWDLARIQRARDLEGLADYGETLNRPEWTLVALERLQPALDGVSLQRARYRMGLAQLRQGSREDGLRELRDVAAAPSPWAGPAAEVIAAHEAGPAEDSPAPSVWSPGAGAWPGYPACVSGLARALRQVGVTADPALLAKRVRIEGADLTSAKELLEILAEDGVPAAQFEADSATLRTVLQSGHATLLRLRPPSGPPTWGVVAGFVPALGLIRILLADSGVSYELPPEALARCLEPLGAAAIALGRPGEAGALEALRLSTSMALEALDQAARLARRGDLQEAADSLARARRYRQRSLPIWHLESELRVLLALDKGSEARAAAETFLEEAAEEWPDESWPALYRARLLLELEHKLEARQLLVAAVRKPFVEAELWTELGDIEEENERFPEAARAWWEAHRIRPLYARPREQLSRHFRRLGERALALALCETALETSDKNPYNWEMLGILLGETGGDADRAEASLRRAMEISPQRPYSYGFLCDTFMKEGRVDDAIRVLEEGVASSADGYPYLVRIAELRFDNQNYAAAIEAAERALSVRPGESAPTALIGASRGRSGELDEGAEILRRAIELDPGDPWAVRELAIHLRAAGRMEAALEALAKGQRHAPDDVGIRAQRALTYEGDGELGKALVAAREALELAGPDQYEVVRLVARLAHLGGNFPVAEAVWRASVSAAAKPEEARKQFLSFLLDVESFALAEREGRAALHGKPDDEELNAWYGYSLVRLERYEEAIPWLRRALAKTPEYPFARSVLLDALTESGEDEQAAEVFELGTGRLTPLGYECAFVAFARLDRPRDALRVSRQASMAVPHAAGFFHRRAARLLLDDLCDFPAALLEAERAVEIEPDDARVHDVHARALAATRSYEASEEAMDRMVEAGASLIELMRFRCYLARRRGDALAEQACALGLAEREGSDEARARRWHREAASASLRHDRSGVELEALALDADFRSRDWAVLAWEAAALGIVDVAEACLARTSSAKNIDVLVARASLAEFEDDSAAAAAFLAQAQEAVPKDHRTYEHQARLLLADGMIAEAKEPAGRAGEIGGVACPGANLIVGLTRLLSGDSDGAREPLARAESLRLDGAPTMEAAMGCWLRGDPQGAETAFEALLASPRCSPVDRRLVARLGEAMGISVG